MSAVCAGAAVGLFVCTVGQGGAAPPLRTVAGEQPAGADLGVTGRVPAGYSSWAELLGFQARLNGAADRVEELAAGLEGYAGVTVPTDDREARLYWKGAVPDAVTRLAGELTASGTRVRILPARYSSVELAAAQRRILDAGDRGITSVAPLSDGSGLRIGVPSGTHADGAVALPDTDGVRTVTVTEDAPTLSGAARSLAAATAPGPVIHFPLMDSWHPIMPWSGGARLSYCSTGFPVSSPYDDTDFVTVAAHCVDHLLQDITTYDGKPVGRVMLIDKKLDTAIVQVQHSGGYVYSGQEMPKKAQRRIVGVAKNRVGNYVCTSGALSLEVCNARIAEVEYSYNSTYNVSRYGGLVRVIRDDGVATSGSEDSGGPVYQLDGAGNAVGAGMIHGGIGDVRCTGVPEGPDRSCTVMTLYMPLDRVLHQRGMRVNGSHYQR